MQAEAGYLSVTGEPDSPPARFGLSIIDLMTGTTAAMALLAGLVQARDRRLAHPSLTPSQLYKTQDGWLFLMCNKEKFWGVLAEILDRPSWTTDERFSSFNARLANHDQVEQELDAVLSRATTAEWLKRLGGRVPAAPVYDIKQALDNLFVAERDGITEAEHPRFGKVRNVAVPVRVNEAMSARSAPELGKDNERLFAELGYDADRIARLRESGTVQ